MSSITHTSLDAFEQRARTGKVTTKVDADLQMIVALIGAARAARAVSEVFIDGDPALDSTYPLERLRFALASVPA